MIADLVGDRVHTVIRGPLLQHGLIDVLLDLPRQVVYDVLFEETAFKAREEEVFNILLVCHLFQVVSYFQSEKHVQI